MSVSCHIPTANQYVCVYLLTYFTHEQKIQRTSIYWDPSFSQLASNDKVHASGHNWLAFAPRGEIES